MKEILSLFTFGMGALCFVLFFTALKPLTVTAASGSEHRAYCSATASPRLLGSQISLRSLIASHGAAPGSVGTC
jgi:hypothetical protein